MSQDPRMVIPRNLLPNGEEATEVAVQNRILTDKSRVMVLHKAGDGKIAVWIDLKKYMIFKSEGIVEAEKMQVVQFDDDVATSDTE